MVIKFTNRRFKYYKIWGPIWIILGVISILISPENYFNYGYIVIGVFHIFYYWYEKRNQYLTIENNVIRKNHLISKKFDLSQLQRIGNHSSYYVLYGKNKDFQINKEYIDQESLEQLDAYLTNLEQSLSTVS